MDTVANIVIPLVAVVIVVVWVRSYRGAKREHQVQLGIVRLSPEEIDGLRERLLNYVLKKTYRRDQIVQLWEFWADQADLTLGDKHAAIKPLLEERVLVVRDPSNEGGVMPYNFNRSFAGVPEGVGLSEKAWKRLVRDDESPRQVIIESIYKTETDMSKHFNTTQSGGPGSVLVNAQTEKGDATATANVASSGLTAEHLARLSAALRLDAETLADPIAATLVADLADEVDAGKEDPDSPETGKLLERVNRVVERVGAATGVLSSTLEVLAKIKHVL